MGVKVQYNPSTGKASYNPATGKVQVVEVNDPATCDVCQPPPSQITATIFGLTRCCLQLIPDDGSRTRFSQEFIDFLNVEHTLDPVGSAANCAWGKTYIVDEPDWIEVFNTSDCSGTPAVVGAIYSVSVSAVIVTDVATGLDLIRVRLRYAGTSTATPVLFQEWEDGFTLPCYDQILGTYTAEIQSCDEQSIRSSSFTTEVAGGSVAIGSIP